MRRASVKQEIQILNARYRAVPYIGRSSDIDRLWDWLVGPEPVSFQVVCGRGGSGKTRLAYQFLEVIEKRVPVLWHAGALESQRIPEALTNERFRRWRGRQPTLIVIDYAASCTEQLARNVVRELRLSSRSADPGSAPEVPSVGARRRRGARMVQLAASRG